MRDKTTRRDPRRLGSYLAAAVLGVFCWMGAAQAWTADLGATDSSLDQKFSDLQKKVQALQDRLDSSSGLLSVLPAGKETSLKFGGMLQVQGDTGDAAGQFSDFTSAYLRRARLNAAGSFLENFAFRVELELAGSLPTTVTAPKALTPAMTDGYVDWTAYPFAQVRLGQFKTPFGFEQLASDPALYTIERSLANDRLTLNRQIGGQLSGSFLSKRLSYAAGAFNGTGVNVAGNDNKLYQGVARVSARPLAGKVGGQDFTLDLGWDYYGTRDNAVTLTGMSVPTSIFTGFRQGRSADAQVHWGPADLWLEWIEGAYQPVAAPKVGVWAQGGYAQLACYVLPKKLQLVAKGDYYDPNEAKSWDITRTGTGGVNYYIKGNDLKLQADFLRIKVEGVKVKNKFVVREQLMF